ncbi:hypothetical protein [Rothia nasimurium]|uniref:hypothetical protein n=1 Tax=Rothia nasimurium TaxID=85336 RepID=UPI001F2D23DD|nr:hypothetical protein [Rothia nasimurium]
MGTVIAAAADGAAEASPGVPTEIVVALLGSGAISLLVTAFINFVMRLSRRKSLRELDSIIEVNNLYLQARGDAINDSLKKESGIYLDAIMARELADRIEPVQSRWEYITTVFLWFIGLLASLVLYIFTSVQYGFPSLINTIASIGISIVFTVCLFFIERDKVKQQNLNVELAREYLKDSVPSIKIRKILPYKNQNVVFGKTNEMKRIDFLDKVKGKFSKIEREGSGDAVMLSKLGDIVSEFEKSDLSNDAILRAKSKINYLEAQDSSDVVKTFKSYWDKNVVK